MLRDATRGPLPSEILQRQLLQLQAQARLEIVKREAEAANGKVRMVLDSLFPEQLAFVLDKSKERAALCTRRAGKSHAIMAFLVEGALTTPGGLSAYICISRPNAEMYFWPELKLFGEKFGLNFNTNEAKLIATLPNGHRIKVGGCPDRSHVDSWRGAAYRRVAVDEAASFGAYIRYLINDALFPGLLDHSGELVLTGTPGIIPAGFFYDVTTGGGPLQSAWPTHSWSVLDNPHVPAAQEDIARLMKRNGWDETNPTYQREYQGKWVRDDSSQIYRMKGGCVVTEAPEVSFRFILGIDIGASLHEPTTAFTIVAFSPSLNACYVMESHGYAAMTAETIAQKIKFFDSVYRFDRVVMDAGGLGGGYIKEINDRHRLNVRAALKVNKKSYIEIFNSDIASGKVRFVADGTEELREQYEGLAWADTVEGDRKEGRQPNHLADATLYAWRESRHFDADAGAEKKVPREQVEIQKFTKALETSARRANGEKLRRKSRWERRRFT